MSAGVPIAITAAVIIILLSVGVVYWWVRRRRAADDARNLIRNQVRYKKSTDELEGQDGANVVDMQQGAAGQNGAGAAGRNGVEGGGGADRLEFTNHLFTDGISV